MFLNEGYPILSLVLAVLAVFTISVSILNRKVELPILSALSRWLRLLLFSQFFTYFLLSLSDAQYSILLSSVTGALVWLLIESMVNWMWIKAFSLSDIPMFPNYKESKEQDFWPIQKRFFKIKDFLQANDFTKTTVFTFSLQEGIDIRNIVYRNQASTIRAQVMCIPSPLGSFTSTVSFYSKLEDGRFIITDNVNVPFGGFYPESWSVNRFPWKKNVSDLYKRHLSVIKAESLQVLGDDLTEINAMQKKLEKLNIDLGFLHELSDWEDNGRITEGGRYRVWKELFFLNYFGKATRSKIN